MSAEKKPTIRSAELMVIKSVKSSKEEGSGVSIRVVQWIYDFAFKPGMELKGYHAGPDGKAFSVKLEKRAYFTKNGMVMVGKAEGFTLGDLAFLHPKWKEMIQLMKNPPMPKPKPAPAAAAKPEDAIEEVPF
jgi:hypothetical protein